MIAHHDYRRVKPGEPAYALIKANQDAGLWVCDSYDHNEPGGCSNPGCFKSDTPENFRTDYRRAINGGNASPLMKRWLRQVLHPGLFEFNIEQSRPFGMFDMTNSLEGHVAARAMVTHHQWLDGFRRHTGEVNELPLDMSGWHLLNSTRGQKVETEYTRDDRGEWYPTGVKEIT